MNRPSTYACNETVFISIVQITAVQFLESIYIYFLIHRTDLSNVPYLKLCINEAMRLYSPVPIICRSSDKHYDLQGRTLPPGKTKLLLLKTIS